MISTGVVPSALKDHRVGLNNKSLEQFYQNKIDLIGIKVKKSKEKHGNDKSNHSSRNAIWLEYFNSLANRSGRLKYFGLIMFNREG